MRIYVSIPISGHDLATQRAKAAEVAGMIKSLGHEPVNPFDTPEAPPEMSDKEKYAYYMGCDIERLLLCDAIFMCEGWKDSKGCRTELAVAERNLIQVFDSFGTLKLINGFFAFTQKNN